jgi:hypothetical protein
MSLDTPKRAVRRARSERARSRKAAVQQFRREVQKYQRMSVAQLEALDYDEMQDALLMRSCKDEED